VKGEVVHDPLSGGQCDDSDRCTENDICQLGTCVGGAPVQCVKPTCAGSVSCVSAEGCVAVWLPVGAVCDDGDACTVSEACNADHLCAQINPTEIDDNNPCTVDACDPTTGEVTHTLRAGVCDDGDACTFGDVCDSLGACAGTTMACPNDGNPCTEDVCSAGVCGVAQTNGTEVRDADLCDGIETCVSGQVTAGIPTLCADDNNPCTDDVCNPGDGACGVAVDDATEVPDADPCDGVETCLSGAVTAGTATVCTDDNNPCTDDVCDSANGACGVAAVNGTEVPDADLCDGVETCLDGAATAGTAVTCVDDGNPCTDDVCAARDGTCGVAKDDGTEVPDADLCDGVETCVDGIVTAGADVTCTDDGNPCINDVCNAADGTCGVAVDDGTEVPDANLCDGTETCAAGVVTDGDEVTCVDDGNPCTLDQCDAGDGLCYIDRLDGVMVPDADLCDGAESCLDGEVADGSPVDCGDDGNRCIDDVCNAADGTCGVMRNDGPLPDTDLCDGEESCVNGVEISGTAVTCSDDGNPCTEDVCDGSTGMCGASIHEGMAMPDDDLCDGTEVCQGGVLVDGVGEDCDDGDPCTAGSCLPDLSCEQVFTCVTEIADGGLAFQGLPALAADGKVIVASIAVPVDQSKPFGSLNRILRVSALASADLSSDWGPKVLHSTCDLKGGPGRTPTIQDARGVFFSYGDWNDGSNNFCASIFSHDLADGAFNWSTQPGGPHPRHDIAIDDTHAFYGGYSGKVRRFQQTDGAIVATMDLSGGSSEGGGIVLLSDGDMVATQRTREVERWTATGTRVWTTTAINSRSLTVTVNDYLLGFNSGTSTLVKLDPADGTVEWSVPMAGDTPVLADAAGRLYLTSEDMAVSLDSDGNLRWSTELNGVGKVQFIGDDDLFYVASPNRLYALEMATGEIVWQRDAHSAPVMYQGAMVANSFSHVGTLLLGGDFFIGDFGGRVYRLALGVDYANAPWPRPRGNRANSGRVWDLAPMTPDP
jgi:outer membrane protein assembly factor BamB